MGSEIKQTISKAWLLEAFYGAYSCLKTKELSKVTVCLNEASKLLENYPSVLLLRANTLFHKKHILLALKDLNCLSEIKHECEGNEKDLRQRINAFVNKREEYKNYNKFYLATDGTVNIRHICRFYFDVTNKLKTDSENEILKIFKFSLKIKREKTSHILKNLLAGITKLMYDVKI